MKHITRRQLALGVPLVGLLASCTMLTGSNTTPLDQIKAYSDTLIDAFSEAAMVYVSSPNAVQLQLVVDIAEKLQQAKVAIDATTSQIDARSIALQIVTFLQQLSPILLPLVPSPANLFIPLALAVLQAFVAALPPPVDAPPAPPPALVAYGRRYTVRRVKLNSVRK